LGSYFTRLRRTLLDMHVPDWDPAFLSRFDSEAVANSYARAGFNAAMIYCKSHVGLCNWPTRVGRQHRGLNGRDIVGELVDGLHARDIQVCAYTSVAFDNDVYLDHPEWRVVPCFRHPNPRSMSRYGILCLNQQDYLRYERDQISELLSRYKFDAFFIDMAFWPTVCVCDACRARARAETGADMPERIDWESPEWARFQDARIRWAAEAAGDLLDHARTLRDIPMYHNFGISFNGWQVGKVLRSFERDDFVGGDTYGDRANQIFVSKVLSAVSRGRPEFMTSITVNLSDHETLKTSARMLSQVLVASSADCAFLFIDAVDPDGAIDSGRYEEIGKAFEQTAPYEGYLGGESIADFGVYYSTEAAVDLGENGVALADTRPSYGKATPHVVAATGACRALQRAHLPFDVVTFRQLGQLGRYKVLILPEATRLSSEEIEAFRAYVKAGGALYASGGSSLLMTTGERLDDFALGDVFGATFEAEEEGTILYLKPADETLRHAIGPQRYLTLRNGVRRSAIARPAETVTTVVRLATSSKGKTLASLTLPFAYPARGSSLDEQWSSIHASPPWEERDHPVLVENAFGKGRAIYSSASLESYAEEAYQRAFVHLMRRLAGDGVRVGAETHPAVWVEARDQAEKSRVVVTLLNYPAEEPALPAAATLHLRAPEGKRFTRISKAPNGEAVAFAVVEGGGANIKCDPVSVFDLYVADYE